MIALFCLTWAVTIIFCIVKDFKNVLNILKIAADQGYEIAPKRTKELSNALYNEEANKNLFLSWIIPGLNLYASAKRQIELEQSTPNIIYLLKTTGVLIEMTDEQYEVYKSTNSYFSFLSIPSQEQIEYEKLIYIEKEIDTLNKDTNRKQNIEELKKLKQELIKITNSETECHKKASTKLLKYLETFEIDKEIDKDKEDTPKLTKKL